MMLESLNIGDYSAPDQKITNATPTDTLKVCMEILGRIANLQKSIHVEFIDFIEFDKQNATPSDVYTMTGLIISELQPIKAHLGIKRSSVSTSTSYVNKKPENVEQIMRWNLKRLKLIKSLSKDTQ
jgi:hypothetical protein